MFFFRFSKDKFAEVTSFHSPRWKDVFLIKQCGTFEINPKNGSLVRESPKHASCIQVGEHINQISPRNIRDIFTYMFLPFPNFLLKSRVFFGNNDQDHLYSLYTFILLKVFC